MATRKKRVKSKAAVPRAAKSCYCGSCNHPYAHVPGYLLASLGIVSLPFSMNLVSGMGWAVVGWPILLILFGVVLIVKAIVCSSKK